MNKSEIRQYSRAAAWLVQCWCDKLIPFIETKLTCNAEFIRRHGWFRMDRRHFSEFKFVITVQLPEACFPTKQSGSLQFDRHENSYFCGSLTKSWRCQYQQYSTVYRPSVEVELIHSRWQVHKSRSFSKHRKYPLLFPSCWKSERGREREPKPLYCSTVNQCV